MIDEYFDSINKIILDFKGIIQNYSTYKIGYNEKQGYIKGEINFKDFTKFHFVEVQDTEINLKIKYSYHYMSENDELIFRYDNAYHHMDIKSFPHHKHTAKQIIDCDEPEISEILLEILKIIKNHRLNTSKRLPFS